MEWEENMAFVTGYLEQCIKMKHKSEKENEIMLFLLKYFHGRLCAIEERNKGK